VAFTSAGVPGLEGRVYPPSLAGPRYPRGIPIFPEADVPSLVKRFHVDEVVFACSDLSHDALMHRASIALAADADFTLLGPASTMLEARKPVVAVCAVRTGSGKSQTSRRVGEILHEAGLKVAVVRHPMPYHDLETIRVQRFATLDEIDASNPSLEEREEYERSVGHGLVMYSGVDYGDILARAQEEADVIVWDGGDNDLPFFRPDLHIVVVDPLRAGQELHYHPGETNVRLADVIVVNKVDTANTASIERVLADVEAINPQAKVMRAASPVTVEHGPPILGSAVLVVEDGASITRGGMPFGAGTVAAQQGGAGMRVDPRPYAVGSIGETLDRYPHIGSVLPAMGYSGDQLAELEATINAVDCDLVIAGTPVRLDRLIACRHPIRHVEYELRVIGSPTLEDVLAPLLTDERLPAPVVAGSTRAGTPVRGDGVGAAAGRRSPR
jgi:predicted GTPase